ncbi:MAG: hypothetical protein NTX59_02545 [Elusimicrobia bacterium]|nr:hypothetical protein [Elusimicrobiota bacterium]
MEQFTGLLGVIEAGNLRQKYKTGSESRLLAFWLDGWPAEKPPPLLDDCFRDKETDTYIFTDTFGLDTYPELFGRIICYLHEIKKLGFKNYELHIFTCPDSWIEEGMVRGAAPARSVITWRLLRGFKILKQFILELYGEKEAGKIFFKVYGQCN